MTTFIVTSEIDGTERRVMIDDGGDIAVEDTTVRLAHTDIPNVWHWIDGGQRVPVHITSDGMSNVTITIRGYAYRVNVLREDVHGLLDILKASPAQKARVTRITAPMPGLLKAILVREGQQVRKGETLFTLEAMKMENVIKTPVGGIVRQVTALEGTAFEKGVLLCVVEPIAG